MSERAMRLCRAIVQQTRMTYGSVRAEYALLRRWGMRGREAEAELRDRYLTGSRAAQYREAKTTEENDEVR